MFFLDIFKKKSTVTKLISDEDFDRLFVVVFINGVDDKFAEIFLKTDENYKTKLNGVKESDIIRLPFSMGIHEFCIKRNLPIIMHSKVNADWINYFLPYLKSKGVSEKLINAFKSCWNID